MGPKAPISYGWGFSVVVDPSLQRNMWIHHGYFCNSIETGELPNQELFAFAVLGCLRLDDSLCVTSSCFPPFSSHGPRLTWKDWQGQGGLWNSSLCRQLLFSSVSICWEVILISSPASPIRQVTSSLVPSKPFVPSFIVTYIYIFYLPASMSGSIPRWDRSFIAGPISEFSVPGPESDPEKMAE